MVQGSVGGCACPWEMHADVLRGDVSWCLQMVRGKKCLSNCSSKKESVRVVCVNEWVVIERKVERQSGKMLAFGESGRHGCGPVTPPPGRTCGLQGAPHLGPSGPPLPGAARLGNKAQPLGPAWGLLHRVYREATGSTAGGLLFCRPFFLLSPPQVLIPNQNLADKLCLGFCFQGSQHVAGVHCANFSNFQRFKSFQSKQMLGGKRAWST